MIQALCNIYAHTAAAVWSGIGWPMSARGNAILCGATAVIVNPGCLALRAVTLSGWAGVACLIFAVCRAAAARQRKEIRL